MKTMKTGMKADLMLFVVVTGWGFSFYLTDIASADLAAFNLSAFRFLLAFAVCGAIFWKKLLPVSGATLRWSLLLGGVLSALYACMNIGVQNTSLSNSGFLCQLTVIVTPFLWAAIHRKSPGKKAFFVAALCMAGIALLTVQDGMSFDPAHLKGDVCCLLCGIVYAFHIVLTEYAVADPAVDPLQLGVWQLGMTGVISLAISAALESPHLPTTPAAWISASVLAVFCTGLAFIVQTLAQQHTPASHVSVIFSLEPVIAGVVAFVFAGEVLTPRAYLGAALMVAAVFIMEVDWKGLLAGRRAAGERA